MRNGNSDFIAEYIKTIPLSEKSWKVAQQVGRVGLNIASSAASFLGRGAAAGGGAAAIELLGGAGGKSNPCPRPRRVSNRPEHSPPESRFKHK